MRKLFKKGLSYQLKALQQEGYDCGARINLMYLLNEHKKLNDKIVVAAVCFISEDHFENVVIFEDDTIFWVDNEQNYKQYHLNNIISFTTIDGYHEDFEIKFNDGFEIYFANQKRGDYKIIANKPMIDKFSRIVIEANNDNRTN